MERKKCARMALPVVVLLFFLVIQHKQAAAQSAEVQQLILNAEKLSQFKQLLNDMKTGYTVVMKGYTTIRDISQGNFSLHKTFLDGLMAVSPVVRNYKKVGDIIGFQLRIVSEYKNAFNRFKAGGYFNAGEIQYIGKVYRNLFDESLKNLDDLTTVVTAGSLRMSDEERLSEVDRIYDDTRDKLLFLRSFNNNTSLLALQRARETNEVKGLEYMYGLP